MRPELGTADTLGDAEGETEGLVDGADVGNEEGALLKLGLLDGDEEGEGEIDGNNVGPELGDVETLGEAEGELEGPAETSDVGPKEGAMLRLGLLDGDEDTCVIEGDEEGAQLTLEQSFPLSSSPSS